MKMSFFNFKESELKKSEEVYMLISTYFDIHFATTIIYSVQWIKILASKLLFSNKGCEQFELVSRPHFL